MGRLQELWYLDMPEDAVSAKSTRRQPTAFVRHRRHPRRVERRELQLGGAHAPERGEAVKIARLYSTSATLWRLEVDALAASQGSHR
eukprot:1897507-Prymnesium_polylepis.1